jgi:glycosyltransferase involved in cell wall biosynthesis
MFPGESCSPTGNVPDAMNCTQCSEYTPVDGTELWTPVPNSNPSNPRVGFISAAYMEIGGTETFHRSLLPRLKDVANVSGFVSTAFHGGDGAKLQVPYAKGIKAAQRLSDHCDVLVVWGIQQLREFVSSRRPRIIAVHHADWSSDWSKDVILDQSDMIDEVICVNADTTKKLAEVFPKPVHWIPNAIDPHRITPSSKAAALRTEFNIPAHCKVVLFGHRLSEEKRPLLAIEIAKHLPNDWTMVIAGDGAEQNAVKAVAAGCDHVRIVGAVDTLADWLSISDCFLSLSTFEGFGLAIGEAMAAGVPTVATPAGIAPGLATTLPTNSTAAEWAQAIVKAKVIVPREFILEQFSVQRMVDAWADVLKMVPQAKE